MSKPYLAVAAALALATAAVVAPAAAQNGNGPRRAVDAAKAQVQGNLDQALQLYKEALDDTSMSNDRRAIILADRGALLARLNQPKLAIEDFNKAVQLYPEYPAIYNNRGSTLLTLGLAQDAIKDFDRAILLAPGYVAAYTNRASANLVLLQNDAAIRDFSKAISLSSNAVAALHGRGRALLAAGRPQAAIRDFSRALQADPRFALGYRSRAEALTRSERFNEAIEDLSRAAAYEPSNVDVYIERGQDYMAVGNVAAAIKDYSRALELNPKAVRALEGRALADIKLDANEEAEADILRGLEIDPRSATLLAVRAVMYQHTDQLDLAQKEIDKAARIDGERAEVLWAKGSVEEALGRRDDAIASYRQALAKRVTLRQAADALAKLGVPPDAGDAEEMRGLGIDGWSVVRRGGRVLAVSRDVPRLEVPLEPVSDGLPRLLEWEVKKPPYKDFALLRFSAGQIASAGGTEEVEHVAIIDLSVPAVLTVVPHRQGAKHATWTWEEGKLTVASVDGLTDEIALRTGHGARDRDHDRDRDTTTVAAAPTSRRSGDDHRSYAPPNWIPWQSGPSSGGPRREARSPSRSKPKTLFDMIFGN